MLFIGCPAFFIQVDNACPASVRQAHTDETKHLPAL
jgi:hypothetical protein